MPWHYSLIIFKNISQYLKTYAAFSAMPYDNSIPGDDEQESRVFNCQMYQNGTVISSLKKIRSRTGASFSRKLIHYKLGGFAYLHQFGSKAQCWLKMVELGDV